MHLIALVVFLLPGHGCAGNPARKQRKRKVVSEFGPVHTALPPGRGGAGVESTPLPLRFQTGFPDGGPARAKVKRKSPGLGLRCRPHPQLKWGP